MKRVVASLILFIIILIVQNGVHAVESRGSELRVISGKLLHDDGIVPPVWKLEITFSSPVNLSSLYHFIALQQNGVKRPYNILRVDYATDIIGEVDEHPVYRFVMSPAEGRAGSVDNIIRIDSGFMDFTKEKVMSDDWTFQFYSGNIFTISSIEPSTSDEEIYLYFTDDVALPTIRKNLSITPFVRIRWYSSGVDKDNKVRISGNFERGTPYLLTFADEFRSQNGLKYSATTNSFTMPHLKPALNFGESFKGIIERDSRQLLSVKCLNIDQVLFEGIRIPLLVAPVLHSALQDSLNMDKNKADYNPENDINTKDTEYVLTMVRDLMKEWNSLLMGDENFDSLQDEPFFERELFFQKSALDTWKEFSLPMSFRKEAEKGSVEFIRLLDNESDVTTDFKIIQITDMAISLKRAEQDYIVWVTSLRTGKPLKNVTLWGLNQELMLYRLGRTDSDGICKISDKNIYPRLNLNINAEKDMGYEDPSFLSVKWIVAQSENDMSYLEVGSDNFLKLDSIDHRNSQAQPSDLVKAYVFTERGIYRPGEIVYFKAILREYKDGSFQVPEKYECHVAIENSKNEERYEKKIQANEFGTIHDFFQTKSYDPVGRYTLTIKDNRNESVLAQRSFEVQEFRAPRHYADIMFKESSRLNNDYINNPQREEMVICTIRGIYYTGGPVKHGQVRWKASLAGTRFNQSEYPEYTFGHPAPAGDDILESGESILDEKGEIQVTLPLNSAIVAGVHGIKLSASVIDFDGRVTTTTETYQVSPELLVGLNKHESYIESETEQKLRFIILDSKKKKIQSGMAKVEIFQQGWSYVRKRNSYGDLYWRSEQVWRKSYDQVVEFRRGEGIFNFSFAWGGEYLVKVSYVDEGKLYSSASVYNVEGDYYYSSSDGNDYEKGSIITDKLSYKPGETITLELRTRLPIVNGLLTVERGGILYQQYIEHAEGEIKIPVKRDFTPNVYISFLGTTARGRFPVYTGSVDLEAPSFVYFAKGIEVLNTDQTLNIEIAGGRDIPKALPGSEQNISFVVTDTSNHGVESELAVCVVDERVLALTSFTTPSLERFLQVMLPLQVFTYESRLFLLKQTPFSQLQNYPLTGGGGLAGSMEISSKVRKNFDPVAYFNPQIVTDEKGQARVTFTLPDTMTTYRLYAVACDRGARFASNQTKLTVVKEFYIEPGFPRFFRKGDTFTASCALFNKSEKGGDVSFDVDYDNEHLELLPGFTTTAITAYDRKVLPISGTALKTGPAKVFLKGKLGKNDDGMETVIPIYTPYVIDTDIISGTFNGSHAIQPTFPQNAQDIQWNELTDKELSAVLTISGSPFMRMSNGLRYLLDYPYGCVEQTSSGVIPLAALRGIISQGMVHNITKEETDKYLEKGIERLLSMQTDSGGFAYWPGNLRPSEWGTMYALTALILSKHAGIEVPQFRLNKALEYLKNEIRRSSSQDYLLRSMGAYLLALENELERSIFDLLNVPGRNFVSLPREAALFSILAAHQANFLSQDEREKLLVQILDNSAASAQDDWYYARYRHYAVGLLAANTILQGSRYADREAQHILGTLNSRGYWTSTSDTGWCLFALASYFKNAQFTDEAVKVKVHFGEGETQELLLEKYKSIDIHVPGKALLNKSKITVEPSVSSTLLYQLETRFPRTDYQKYGYSNGFSIEKKITNTDGSDSIAVGDIVKVIIRIKIPVSAYRFIALTDPLPAGLVAINSAIKTEETITTGNENDESYWWNYWDQDGFYRFSPNYMEIRDERVDVFKDYSWAGTFQYSYFARAVCEGNFIVPSTSIHLMYWPETQAYSPQQLLKIEARNN